MVSKQHGVKMNKKDTAIFYSCGICNLNCNYCCIDKNPILKEIDKELGESFQGDYYFNQVKKYFPLPGSLRQIETWGGEPFLKMERMHNLIRQLCGYYFYFNSFYSSTNFSFPQWADKVLDLLKVFGEFFPRRFTIHLQLSIDGPEYINDRNRGIGTTQKCLNNFNILISRLPNELPKNINLIITTKGTLDNSSIMALDSKNKVIEYYQFIENNFIRKIDLLNLDNVKIEFCIPNTADPSPVTKEIGKHFANICKWCREIEQENEKYGYFRYYKSITPFSQNIDNLKLSYNYPNYTCGTGYNMIGFLPNNMIASCHESFVYLIEKYKDFAKEQMSTEVNKTINFNNFISNCNACKMCMSEKNFPEHERCMSYYNQSNTMFRLANITNEIMCLALAKQIDPKYAEEEKALSAAIYLQSATAYCIKNNYEMTGSYSLVSDGILKLLFNGAADIIEGINDV